MHTIILCLASFFSGCAVTAHIAYRDFKKLSEKIEKLR